MRFRLKLGAVALVAASATLLAAGPAMAGTCCPVSGNENVDGAVYGEAAIAQSTTIPLRLSGMVDTHSVFTLPGYNRPAATIPTPKGDLYARLVGKMVNTSKVYSNCYAIFNVYSTLKITGGTGEFRGAHGPGHLHLLFAAFVPRYKSGRQKGQCNPNANPVGPQGAEAALDAQVTPLTILVHKHH